LIRVTQLKQALKVILDCVTAFKSIQAHRSTSESTCDLLWVYKKRSQALGSQRA